MEKTIRVCHVCGKEYPYCWSEHRDKLFCWQDVACCPEHASIYFAEVERIRSGEKPQQDSEKKEEAPENADKKTNKRKH